MRDKRFVAVHRGGSLDRETHNLLATWAADCAEHVLPLFETVSSDNQPRRAIETARAWVKGEVRVGDAQKAAVAAHTAAREVHNPSATASARAAGHAVATAHMADHSLRAVHYALKAGGDPDRERAWQEAQLPSGIRDLVLSAQALRAKKPR